jgi:leader peptidase (prepilin peptidase)/N-methyltransferase
MVLSIQRQSEIIPKNKDGNDMMIYLILVLTGLISGIIINLITSFEKPADKSGIFLWFLGYAYSKIRFTIVLGIMVFSFLLIFYIYRDGFEVLKFCTFFILIMIASLKDLKSREIPNILILGGIVLGLIFSAVRLDWNELVIALIVFIATGTVLVVVSIISKGGLGMGDVKLIAVTSLFTGFTQVLSILFISLVLAAIMGIGSLALKKLDRKSSLPFAPFLATGFILHLFLI